MTTSKNLYGALIGGLLVAIVALLLILPRLTQAASPAGSQFGDSKQAAVAINLSAPGVNATSTSLINTDGNDRFITSEKAVCEGVGTSKTAYTGTGLSAITLTLATSTTANPASNANTNTLPVITIGTSTPNFGISSSTVGTPGNNLVSNIWLAGSALTITANATNTATCTVGVDYIGL